MPEGYKIEGSWGPWNTMTVRRDTFKKDMAGREKALDGRFAIDLDHNPEYQILWRLGHTEFSNSQRETGTLGTPGGRVYPEVAKLYNNGDLAAPSRDRAGADQDRVMAIRYDVHRSLSNTQAPQVAAFDALCEYSSRQKAFVPRKGKTKELHDMKWASPVQTAANTHRQEVTDSYAAFAKDNFVDKRTAETIGKNGEKMVTDGISILQGGTIAYPTGEEAPGFTSGIGMSPDPVDAEFLTGDYEGLATAITAKAKAHGGALDKHHLIEESITSRLQSLVNGQDLLPALKDPAATVMGVALGGTPLRDTIAAGFDTLRAKTPALAGVDSAKKVSSFLGALRVDPAAPMKTENTHKKGYAIAVLRKINGVLGAQDAGNVDTAISAHLQQPLRDLAATATDAVTSGFNGITIDPAADPAKAEEDLASATAAIRADFKSTVGQGFATAATKAFPAVLDTLTANAHKPFTDQVSAADKQTEPANGAFPDGSEAATLWADLQARYKSGPGNLSVVQAENKKRWVA